MINPYSHLRVETLVTRLGAKATANLCFTAGGHRVPRSDANPTRRAPNHRPGPP